MRAHRFPVLVWEDYEGYYTASLVADEDNTAAIGRTPKEALRHVEDYVAWLHKRDPYREGPDFLDAQLIHFAVEVRPEYRDAKHVYPCDEPMALLVACVHGRQEGGLLVAALPVLGLRFYYNEPERLKPLAVHYAQTKLKGMTPQELARYLPPKSVALSEVVVRAPRRPRRPDESPAFAVLASVADPLDDSRTRRQFSRAWGRDGEIADLAQRLGKEKANVILVGEPGVGKTTVLANAARKLQRAKEADARESRPRRRCWQTNALRLIAGMRYLGQWQERCERAIEELSECEGILCAENALDLVRTGGAGPVDSIAAFLVPFLRRGELRVVAEATPAEMAACRRLLPGFADLFEILEVRDFDRGTARLVLDEIAGAQGQNLHLEVGSDVGEATHRLFARFLPYHALPGRAAGFLRRLFERASLERTKKLTASQVTAAFVEDTGLPEVFLRDDLVLAPTEAEEALRKRILGQDDACRAATRFILAFKAGLNDPNRPMAALLFCGPTGVGKTEMAKTISQFLFGHGRDKDRLVRLDMSEYAGSGAAERFLGESGDEPSELVKRVRRQPFTVVLLDEIEKAAPEVLDVLLGVLDEGRLTDQWGRTTTFRSTAVIMTSNLGAQAREAIGFGSQPTPSYDAEAMAFFRPEFYNRIDAIVAFHPLDPATIHAITAKELAEIAQREGFAKADIRLEWTDALVEHVARHGFDRRYGARPLQRMLETLVVTPVARYLAERPTLKGARIRLDVRDGANVVVEVENG